MAEKEKKEKTSFNMNIWFIIFVVYLGLSIVYFINQNQTITDLNTQVASLNTQLDEAIQNSNQRSESILKDLEALVEKYNDSKEVTLPTPVGTYTGSAVVSGDEVLALSMTLTLSENNVATVSVTNEAGNSLINGTYNVVSDSVTFTSEDGLTNYTFTVVNENTLVLVDNGSELTLVK